MAIESICSGCGKKLAVPDEYAGKRGRCPACGQIYSIPLQSSPSTVDPLLAETSAGSHSAGSPNAGSMLANSSQETFGTPDPYADPRGAEEFWMRADNGTEYGPVDRPTLDRWFREGRVGPNYQLRSGSGSWQPAASFQPAIAQSPGPSNANPYAATASTSGAPLFNYPKKDQGVVVLVMGILGFVLCPIFGIVAWIMGGSALKDIKAGLADPSSKTLVQIGYYLGIASVILNLLCIGGYIVIAAIAIVAEAN